MHTKKRISSLLILVFVLLISLVTFVAWRSLASSLEKQAKVNLELKVSAISNTLETLLKRDMYLLHSIKGLFDASEVVERDEFTAFLDAINLSELYPQVNSIAYIERTPAEAVPAFETALHAAGFTDNQVSLLSTKTEYYLTKYAYLPEQTVKALGFDFASEVSRRTAAEQARDTGEISLTTPVLLVTDQKQGVAMILPLYQHGTVPDSEIARQEQLRGLLVLTLKVEKIFTSLTENLPEIALRAFDSTTAQPIPLFNNESNEFSGPNESVQVLNVGGRTWTIVFSAAAQYGLTSIEQISTWMLGLASFVITVLFLLVIWNLLRAREHAEKLADAIVRDLTESKSKFQVITEFAKDAIIMMDNLGAIILWNKAAEEMFGYQAAEVLGQNLHQIITAQPEHRDPKRLAIFGQTGKSDVLSKSLELPVRHKDGHVFTVELTISRTKINDKWHAIGIMRDISARKTSEGELKQHALEMERMNKLMVGREQKMRELKQEIKKLESKITQK